MDAQEIVSKLKRLENPANRDGMARFGINPVNTLGISIPILRKIAKEIGKNNQLSQQLWDTKIHEARLLAIFIADSAKFTEKKADKWIKEFDSWDICDQCCIVVFRKLKFAYRKAEEWAFREKEFEKRAGFSLIATLAVHDKEKEDTYFLHFLDIIEQQAGDDRNFVKKSVNWALRQIGKKNTALNKKAIACARKIEQQETRSAKWIAKDALKELTIKDKVRSK